MSNVTMAERSKLEVFQRTTVFNGLDSRALQELVALATPHLFADGATLFCEGDPAAFFFIVQAGCAKLYKTSRSGKNLTCALVIPGEAVNGLALTLDEYYMTAEAVGELTVLRIGRRDYLNFLMGHPAVALRLLAVVAQNMNREHERLLDFISQDAEHRLVHSLRVLAKKFGPRISLSREELAQFTGLTTETTIRLLSQLKQHGIIAASAERGTVVIADLEKLETYKGF
jgi:CRP-like cAMP-binding protein